MVLPLCLQLRLWVYRLPPHDTLETLKPAEQIYYFEANPARKADVEEAKRVAAKLLLQKVSTTS